jgi:uncharacterized membrane protein YgcG
MTTAADDSAAEEAFEAYLAGRSVAAEGAHLAAFAGAVRATAHEPGRPNAALAELLATGLLVDQPLPSARTAKRRRRPMWFFTAILAKIASAGAVAQAAAGAGIVLVGFTGAGAAGALPDPAQHTFATVVAAITPLTAPDRSGSTGTTTTEPVTTTPPATPTTDPAGTTEGAGGTAVSDPATTSTPKNFGQKVSEYAKNGGVDGHQVSSWAHERKHGSAATGAPETEAPETEAPETEGPDDDSAHRSGHGHSGGEGGHGDSGGEGGHERD